MTSNSQLPYEFCKESDWNYSFITISGVKYIAYFVDYSVYHPDFDEVYTFNFEPEESTPHPIDPKIAATIVTILREFFQSKERAMILVCDNIDGKENKRNRLFSRWYTNFKTKDILKFDASATTEGYQLYVSILLSSSHPRKEKLIAAFYELVKNEFYPVEYKRRGLLHSTPPRKLKTTNKRNR